MDFLHLQYVVTQGFQHVMPVRISDPANEEQVTAAFVAYPNYETTLTHEQFVQWRETVQSNPHPSNWFGMTEEKELKLIGQFDLKHDAAMAAAHNPASGIIPKSAMNWMKSQTWAS